MIFPFMDFIDRYSSTLQLLLQRFHLCMGAQPKFSFTRFQGQPELDRCKPKEFQIAMEEAFLAERGFTEKLIADINMAAGNMIAHEFLFRGTQEATASNQDPHCHSPPNRTCCIKVHTHIRLVAYTLCAISLRNLNLLLLWSLNNRVCLLPYGCTLTS